MNQAMNVVLEDQNNYRLVMKSKATGQVFKMAFHFGKPAEAREAKVLLQQQYPHCKIWLEDRQGNEVEIPKR